LEWRGRHQRGDYDGDCNDDRGTNETTDDNIILDPIIMISHGQIVGESSFLFLVADDPCLNEKLPLIQQQQRQEQQQQQTTTAKQAIFQYYTAKKTLSQHYHFGISAPGEAPDESNMFFLGFDPLDGSSVIDANFSVGSIFGIWPGKGVLNRTGREQVASAISVYGPRTTLCIALPAASTTTRKDIVLEVTLVNNRALWELSRDEITIKPDGKVFAPGNLRATNDNTKYNAMIQYWIQNRYTLRYTGGMVPDVYHIFAKSKGVFSNVSAEKAKAKLRLLYEVAPIGLMVKCAKGVTTHEAYDKSVLDIPIQNLDQRLGVCFGSANEVTTYKKFMFENNKES
jgi:fructose-1,6-bisphosphatase